MSQTATSSQRRPLYRDCWWCQDSVDKLVGIICVYELSDTVEIPDDPESAVTVKFLGFTESAAEQIYARFDRARQNMQYLEPTLLAMARATINMNTSENMNDWDREMRDMGIDHQIRAAMVAPGHDMVRSTASLGEWLVITIAERMDFLESLDTIILGGRPAPPPPGVPGSSMDPPDCTRTPSGPASRVRRPQMGHFASPKGSETAADVEEMDETVRPGDFHFLQGGRYSRLEEIRDAEPRLKLSKARSLPPTDFSCCVAGVYLTSQWQTAWHYADWARERHPVEGGGILHFSVPRELLVGRRDINGRAWQRLVWCSRGQKPLVNNYAEWDDISIVDGPVCGMSTAKLRKLADEGHDETCVEAMRLPDGESASQLFIRARTGAEEVAFGSRLRVWLDRIRVR